MLDYCNSLLIGVSACDVHWRCPSSAGASNLSNLLTRTVLVACETARRFNIGETFRTDDLSQTPARRRRLVY